MLVHALAIALTASSLQPVQAPPACVALVLPSVQGVEGNAVDVAGAVRELFVSYLNGPAIRTLTLDARLASQAVTEAGQKHCGQILLVTVIRRHSSGGLGKAIGQGAGTAAWYLPGATSVGGAVVRSAAVGGAQAVATMAASTRAKDEIRIEYTISALDSAGRAPAITEKAKARVDREDLLTPLVERASKAIAAAVTGK